MNAILTKLGIIVLMVLLMLIPVTMIRMMIEEREGNKKAEQTELNLKWGGSQKFSGAVIVLPYWGKDSQKKYAYFMPEKYMVTGDLDTEERQRGIQKVLSFSSKIHVEGSYAYPDYKKLGLKSEQIIWNEACIAVGILNLQGVKNDIKLNLNDKHEVGLVINATNDVKEVFNNNVLTALLPADVFQTETDTLDFKFDLNLSGAGGIRFVPVGKYSNIALDSYWKSLSFIGDIVPAETSDNEKGTLNAQWVIYDYNRNFESAWLNNSRKIDNSIVGVDLLMPLNHYQQTMRAVKYAILFITLTFLIFFMLEILGYQRIHPFQYLLVSLAMILFYTLLLSFSEHIRFGFSYLIASVSTILLITIYSKSIFKKLKSTIFMGGFLSLLYTYLYVVLQQEDMALLLGSVGLFIGLAAVMYTSRRINWYKEEHDFLE